MALHLLALRARSKTEWTPDGISGIGDTLRKEQKKLTHRLFELGAKEPVHWAGIMIFDDEKIESVVIPSKPTPTEIYPGFALVVHAERDLT